MNTVLKKELVFNSICTPRSLNGILLQSILIKHKHCGRHCVQNTQTQILTYNFFFSTRLFYDFFFHFYTLRCLFIIRNFLPLEENFFLVGKVRAFSYNFYYLLVSIWTNASGFIIFCTIIISTIIECTIPLSYRSAASLILKMPIETDKRTVLIAFVLQKRLTLFHAKFL